MINLLRMELFKLAKLRIFWTMVIISTVGFAFLHYLITIGWWQVDNVFGAAGLEMFSSLGLVTAPFYFILFVSTLTGFFVANEFTIGVVKNMVMSGNRRSYLFAAKLLILALGSMFITLVCPLVLTFTGKLVFGFGVLSDPSGGGYLVRALGLFLLHMLAVVAFIMVIALLVEDSGKTIIIGVVIALAASVLEVLRPLPGILDTWYSFSVFHHLIDAFRMELTYAEIVKSLSVALGTIVFLILWGNWVFRRKELR